MTDPVMLLSQLHGEGRVTFRALKAAGFASLRAVAEAPLQSLSDRAHLSGQTARRLKRGAEEMLEQGIGREAASLPVPARSGRPAARTGRSGDDGKAPVFSAGVGLEEAALLGQGPGAPAPTPPGPASGEGAPAPAAAQSDSSAASQAPPIEVAAAPPSAAASRPPAAERAVATPPPAGPPHGAPSEPPARPAPPAPEARRSFWRFG